MKHLVNKVVIFTLVNNVKISALVEGIYKKNLILKIPIRVCYDDGVRQLTNIESAISDVDDAKKSKDVSNGYVIKLSGDYGYKREFTYHMLPIENVLKYEVSKEDLINIIAKDK